MAPPHRQVGDGSDRANNGQGSGVFAGPDDERHRRNDDDDNREIKEGKHSPLLYV
jgi:hypothetical protein